MRTVETAVSALTEPARLARKGRRRRRRGSEEGARIRRLGRRELAGAFRNGRCRGWKRCSHCGQSRNKWTTSPLVAAMAAAIQTPSGGTDRFDEHRKRRIADQILFVPRAARRQRDRTIEQPRHLQRNRKFVDSPPEGDGFEYWSRRGETPLGRAMWFPRTAPPAWRGTARPAGLAAAAIRPRRYRARSPTRCGIPWARGWPRS